MSHQIGLMLFNADDKVNVSGMRNKAFSCHFKTLRNTFSWLSLLLLLLHIYSLSFYLPTAGQTFLLWNKRTSSSETFFFVFLRICSVRNNLHRVFHFKRHFLSQELYCSRFTWKMKRMSTLMAKSFPSLVKKFLKKKCVSGVTSLFIVHTEWNIIQECVCTED